MKRFAENLHIQTWPGSCSATVIDMRNAGKRGQTCQVLRLSGCAYGGTNPELQRAHDESLLILHDIETCPNDTSFVKMREMINDRAARFASPYITAYQEEIRAVDAPVPVLSAGDGATWTAEADETGVTVLDERDQNNLPAAITSRQSKGQAYRLARKVWEQVKAAGSFSAACDVLRAAGCKLHYYCRMD